MDHETWAATLAAYWRGLSDCRCGHKIWHVDWSPDVTLTGNEKSPVAGACSSISGLSGIYGSGGRGWNGIVSNTLIYQWIRAFVEISSKGLVAINRLRSIPTFKAYFDEMIFQDRSSAGRLDLAPVKRRRAAIS